ncbi:MAG: hypothetical protein US83_C0001G0126 [Candidatus Falkowbacteria bacterium GW2011_GWC2_38_22]|uniref:Uncharacterized protein n=1 Tax=Candidatus Falkowbacteria bacterium GW2011_GWE1_38_31 TaxID=1618638 RepID=A0A0G0JWN1_9BACT|nr:MAG: hypothetical protein US73_C0004G0002 [Candidatus Falkowbacteria bacterium GW2011_GWF2_38_1205]KKQ62192.1 MAG: hypothetical protein US83_C0001G0126 [Candidatus Falkowbacteria bacterium GW2011_GWC2_38_22]KKQ64342.1 MAG: hypothetical protein US84_C0001G0126 [Candidatus Falkowbacteria bacterium GW2011_GWF1_38_22]KKQ66319.1 MAG: hypothetical protein US87_C0002G0126 [Candidatus Falkowbacteria bacterium GW2011_GWE2_38_254]KKQ71047.1 MAG: hypothetical protein US91_C0002G0126 [Candidatus Falkowb
MPISISILIVIAIVFIGLKIGLYKKKNFKNFLLSDKMKTRILKVKNFDNPND